VADAYLKTFNIDEIFEMEDTIFGQDQVMLLLPGDSPTDALMWSNSFVAASGNHPQWYIQNYSLPLDEEGNYIDNSYSNCGVLLAYLDFSTFGNPVNARLHGTVQAMFLPVIPDPTP
jgi:hypothetical protein